MNSRNRRRNRQANMKARIGLAGAVLVGGGAAGVAVAASHGPATTNASEAGYIMGIRHNMPASQALSGALSTWGRTNASHQRALLMLAQMNPMRNFNQVWGPRHTRFAHTQFAAQRGTVTATGTVMGKQFVVVRSANGQQKIWWLSGNTAVVNAASSANAMAALTGTNTPAAAAVNGNTTPAVNQVAGSTTVAAKAAAGAFSFTGTFTINGQTFTITISATTGTGTVTPTTMAPTGTVAPTTMAPTGTVSASAPATGMATGMATGTVMPTSTATMPVAVTAVAKGQVVLITGVRSHGQLSAQLVVVLQAAPTVTPTPSTSTGQTMTVAPSTAPATAGAHL
jgi:hypothetical protein